jgi:uncharacterized phage protein gp47/JayE
LDLFSVGRAYVLTRATRVQPEQVDVQGSNVNLIVGSTSEVAFYLVKQLAYQIARLFIDSAKGEDLDRLAWDRYQLVRKGAAPAQTYLTFSRPTADAGGGTIPGAVAGVAGAIVLSLTNAQYVLTQDATFGASDLTVSGIAARAVLAGKDYQVGANYLTKLRDTPFDPTITVTNPDAAWGGEDREDDDTFRARIRNFWSAARRGTLAAIEFGATTVDGVVSAHAIEALDGLGTPAGAVTLYIADSSGGASAAQGAAVLLALEEWRAAGIPVAVVTGAPQMTSVQYSLKFTPRADTVGLTSIILAATVGFVNGLPVNTPLTRAALFSLLQRYTENGLLPDDTSIVVPAGDVVPDAGRSLRAQPEDVTAA